MNLKILKPKKNPLDEINKEFLAETLNAAKIIHERISDLIDGKLEKTDLKGVILCERTCDKLKEKYIEILFKNKKALPFLVEDRYKIVVMIDKMTGKNEFVARYIRAFPFDIYDDVKDQVRLLCELYFSGIEGLIDCATLMETDFNAAYKKTFEIESNRRDAKKMKFRILDKLYQKKDNFLQVYLTSKLVSYIYEVLNSAEEISDYLRGLVIKYPSK